MSVGVREVETIVRRMLGPLAALVELVDAVEHGEEIYITGKGVAGQTVQADVAGQYGVYSRAPDGGDAVVLKLGGKGASSICVGYRHRSFEVKVEKGEVQLRDDQGQYIHIKRAGIDIDAQEVKMCGGTHGATREGDPVEFNAAFSQWLNITLVPALNGAGIPVPVFPGPEIGVTTGGSAKVKIG